MLTYEILKLSKNEILTYLAVIDKKLIPKLSGRVDLDQYSEKLFNNAIHFCVTEEEIIIGFCACYFNNPVKKTGYISSFSVSESFREKGIAKNLLKFVTEYGLSIGYEKIILNVYFLNKTAIILYEKCGFTKQQKEIDNNFIVMTYYLKENKPKDLFCQINDNR
jgi:ribosomal protein S18 acetylase RimI-like enzyme